MATKKELQEELDQLGIMYPRRATKSELEMLLAMNAVSATPIDYVPDDEPEDDGGEVAQSFTGPTGLCTQCKRPADHKHKGV